MPGICDAFFGWLMFADLWGTIERERGRGRKRKPLNPTISNTNYLFLGGDRSAVVATTTIMMIGNIERWRR